MKKRHKFFLLSLTATITLVTSLSFPLIACSSQSNDMSNNDVTNSGSNQPSNTPDLSPDQSPSEILPQPTPSIPSTPSSPNDDSSTDETPPESLPPAPDQKPSDEVKPESTIQFSNQDNFTFDLNSQLPTINNINESNIKKLVMQNATKIFDNMDSSIYNEQFFQNNLSINPDSISTSLQTDDQFDSVSFEVILKVSDQKIIRKKIKFNGFKSLNQALQGLKFNDNYTELSSFLISEIKTNPDLLISRNIVNISTLFSNDPNLSIKNLSFDLPSSSNAPTQMNFCIAIQTLENGAVIEKVSNVISLPYSINDNYNDVDIAFSKLESVSWIIDNNQIQDNSFITLSKTTFNKNGFIKNIANFDSDQFERDNSIRLDVSYFDLDALKLQINFDLVIKKNDDFAVKRNMRGLMAQYKPKTYHSKLDDPNFEIDNDVKLVNSLKGSLEEIQINENGITFDEFAKKIDGYINKNQTIRNRECLYALRFFFYQAFGDYASSIDYGIEGWQNNTLILVLKAKLNRGFSQFPAYWQPANMSFPRHDYKMNDIIELRFTVSNADSAFSSVASSDFIGWEGLDQGIFLSLDPKKTRRDLGMVGIGSTRSTLGLKVNNLEVGTLLANYRFLCFNFLQKLVK